MSKHFPYLNNELASSKTSPAAQELNRRKMGIGTISLGPKPRLVNVLTMAVPKGGFIDERRDQEQKVCASSRQHSSA